MRQAEEFLIAVFGRRRHTSTEADRDRHHTLSLFLLCFYQRKAECWRETLDCVLFFRVPPRRQVFRFHVIFVGLVFVPKELPTDALADGSFLVAHLGFLTIRLASTRRLGIRTEVPVTPVGAPILHWIRTEILATGIRPRNEARAWSAACASRSHRSTWPWSWAGIRPVLPCAGFINCNVSSLERLIVQSAAGFLGMSRVAELDKRKSSPFPRLAIDGHDNGRKRSNRSKKLPQIRFSHIVGKIPHKQTYRHCSPFKTPANAHSARRAKKQVIGFSCVLTWGHV
jgi:hypothetical protein